MWPGAELAGQLGVTSRTLRRDIGRLRSLGYTIDSDVGAGGGYALSRGTALPPLLLDTDEAVALSIALASASAAGHAPDAAALRAQAKLEQVLPSRGRERVAQIRRAIRFADRAEPEVGAELLAGCARAVGLRRRIRFHYVDRHGRPTRRWAEPYELTAHGSRWTLACFDVDRADWRSFRLDRMSDLRVTDWEFRHRGDSTECLERVRRPRPTTEYPHYVHATVDCGAADLPAVFLSGGSEVTARGSGRIEYRTGVEDPLLAAQWMARLGHDFTVHGDSTVRAAIDQLAGRLHRSVGAEPQVNR